MKLPGSSSPLSALSTNVPHQHADPDCRSRTKMLFIVIILLACSSHVSAQSKQVLVTGRVLESIGGVPIEFASVAVKDKKDDSLLTGTTTNAEGRFEILCKHAAVYVEISFMGFIKKTITTIEEKDGRIVLGDVMLEE